MVFSSQPIRDGLRPVLRNIPVHLVAGGLGVGKTTLIQHWLQQKPSHEHWAVLINEFGQIGLDAALLGRHAQVQILELSGGCVCCVNGVPFRTALGQLLRQSRPDRLLIEPSGLGHPQRLLAQLREKTWQGVLDIQPVVWVVDAQAWLREGQPELVSEWQDQAGLVVFTKGAVLSDAQKQALEAQVAKSVWSLATGIALTQLPGFLAVPESAAKPRLPAPADLPLEEVLSAQVRVHTTDTEWSIGWQWPPSQRLSQAKTLACLNKLPWLRAKLVVHFEQGWYSANALAGDQLQLKASEWRKDSRLEMIFQTPQNEDLLQTLLMECLYD